MPVISLPMYAPNDLPPVREATDALLALLQAHLTAAGLENVTIQQDPPDLYAHWQDPELLLSQTCGWPLTHELENVVRPVATPCYDCGHCRGPYYRSLIVVRRNSPVTIPKKLDGSVCAINGADSHSGCNAMLAYAAGHEIRFRQVILSGSHLESLRMVAEGAADTAAIDCVTYALLQHHAPAELTGIRVLDRTPEAPGLPLVTRAGSDDETLGLLRQALQNVLSDPTAYPCREALLLKDFDLLSSVEYQSVKKIERQGLALRSQIPDSRGSSG